jgi:alkyl hydroperoxide reductase subunit AhpC
VKVIGISANNLDDHKKWIKDINTYGGKVGPTDVQFPIVCVSFQTSIPDAALTTSADFGR